MTDKKNIWIVYLSIGLIIVYFILKNKSDDVKVSYSDFKKFLKSGVLKEVVVSDDIIVAKINEERIKNIHDENIKKKIINDNIKEIKTISLPVKDESLVKELEESGVSFKGERKDGIWSYILSWFLPLIIFVGIWIFLIRKTYRSQGGILSFGKSKVRVYKDDDVKTTFKDVAGVDEAKEELQEVIDYLKTPDKFIRIGAKIPKGVLLVGAPGTGKTLLARAVAGEARVSFFSISGSEFVEMFVGVGAARVRDLFEQALKSAPCIIFIDELDALGRSRTGAITGNEEREQTLNQLLVEMDGFETNKGVVIMAATNRPEILDPALLRPGRFDRHILVDVPDRKGREEILKVHAKGVKVAEDVDLEKIARRTAGFVGADLANVINESALLAARKGKAKVEMKDVEEAVERVVAGLEKKSRIITEKERKIIAIHEMGHAIVAETLDSQDKVEKISIVPRGLSALGYTLQLPTEDRYLKTESELKEKICVLLGGRVAEEIIFEESSTGAQHDLSRATDLARSMVLQFGMSDEIGPLSFERPSTRFFQPDFSLRKEYGDEVADKIDREVKKIIDDGYKKVEGILYEKKNFLEFSAKILLEKEYMEGDELRELLKRQEGF